MAETIFLDVNVFMYAAGAPHPYKGPCLRILTDLEMGVVSAVINTEILQELLYRYSHIGMADRGIQLCREILNYPLTILPVTEPDVRLAIDLLDVYQAKRTIIADGLIQIKTRQAARLATIRTAWLHKGGEGRRTPQPLSL